jgi:acyl carrier protein phosphodiesterase
LSEAIPTVLATTGQRLTRSNPLRCSGEQFLEHYDALESIFFDFFPALQAFALEHQQQTGTRLFRKKFNRALDSD